MNDARRPDAGEEHDRPMLQPDPVDEGPSDDRRPLRGPHWAKEHLDAVEDETVEGAQSIRTTDNGSSD